LKKKSFARRLLNRVLHSLARALPGATSVRPFLHRLRGVRIEGKVFIGDDVYIENEYPESVELRDGAQITLRSTIIAHTRGPGRVVLEENTFVGAHCVLVCSPGSTLTIGEGSVVSANSVVTTDVPPQMLYGCERAKPLMRAAQPLTMDTSYEAFVAGLHPLKSRARRPD